ncbi:hypothetical protein [Postechiella marina]
MKTSKILFLLFISIAILIPAETIFAQAWGYNNNRVAVSFDGNSAADNQYKWPTGDPDDWGALAASCAIMAKLGLQDKLVHCSYNNFIDAPPGPDNKNQLKISADGSIARWGFNKEAFFDVTKQLKESRSHLANEMGKSTASNPLYFMHAGLSEFIYQVVEEVIANGNIEALNHVYLLSHSKFNENEIRRDYHRTWADIQKLCGNRIKYKKIKDQNDKGNPNNLWHSKEDFSVWYWMRDHKDPNINWMYTRVQAHTLNHADISDCGMFYYLLVGDDNGSPEKFKTFIGEGIPSTYNNSDLATKEEEKLIIIEAEKFSLKANWKINKDTIASNGKYIEFTGSNLYKAPNHDNTISYNFKIDTPGNYTVKWFMRQPEGERGTDKGNDAWIYFSNNKGFADNTALEHYEKFYGRSTDDFVLNGTAEIHDLGHKWLTAKFNKPGEYTINISGRSSKLQIDNIILFKGITIDEASKKTKLNKSL